MSIDFTLKGEVIVSW